MEKIVVLAFWPVDSNVHRHKFDTVDDKEAFKALNRLGARFYAMNAPQCQWLLNDYEFEEDYNNEKLDGGWWTKVMSLTNKEIEDIVTADED